MLVLEEKSSSAERSDAISSSSLESSEPSNERCDCFAESIDGLTTCPRLTEGLR